jgi:hypothetical protein
VHAIQRLVAVALAAPFGFGVGFGFARLQHEGLRAQQRSPVRAAADSRNPVPYPKAPPHPTPLNATAVPLMYCYVHPPPQHSGGVSDGPVDYSDY